MELMEVDDEEEGGALVELLLMVMEEVELGRSWAVSYTHLTLPTIYSV